VEPEDDKKRRSGVVFWIPLDVMAGVLWQHYRMEGQTVGNIVRFVCLVVLVRFPYPCPYEVFLLLSLSGG